ncbi:uncharacterized protein LOC134187845 isoform X3 [Corticium candelabrum]|uniref:uncharacterized protein LOC134187845 isoform X3 n=1 Tax=Corticium candelabrum TaxID=121492 RepID=UPI002E275FB0|nr:uncharacterized protein LOC134187845 isoform X3 [Corticium candelabrum]
MRKESSCLVAWMCLSVLQLWPQPRSLHVMCTICCKDEEIKVLLMGGWDESVMKDCWMIDAMRGSIEKLMIDGDVFARCAHSFGCVTLSDDTVAISVFGDRFSSNSVISSPCFYQWNPHHPSVLHNGFPAAGDALRAVSSESTSALLAGETSQEVTVTC